MIDTADGLYSANIGWVGMVREDVAALVAATFPVKPPRSWFENPGLREVTPLTIDSTGRAFGHVATWRQSHIGLAGGVKAPRSRSNYAFFQTGALECDDGSHVNVGQITLAGGHASLDASVAEAVSHYDNTRSAVVDVAVGEDDHGIWVAGGVRPDVDELKLRTIRASSVSGDWRPINGNLELVAICAVNVPGFPIPRARVASGQVVALVAAGTEDLVTRAIFDHVGVEISGVIAASTSTIDRRLAFVEDALLNRARDRRVQIDDAVSVARRSLVAAAETAAVSRARVHSGGSTTWDDGAAIEASTGEMAQANVVAGLRARVASGEMVATATSKLNTEKRKTAAKKGQALPDGSFPIIDKTDWYKARQALGRAKDRSKVVRHLKKRGRALKIPQKDLEALAAGAIPFAEASPAAALPTPV